MSKIWVVGVIAGGSIATIIAILVSLYLEIDLTDNLLQTILNGTLALTGILIAVVGVLLSLYAKLHQREEEPRKVLATLISFTVLIITIGFALIFSSFLYLGNEIYRELTKILIISLFLIMIMMIIPIVIITVAYIIRKG